MHSKGTVSVISSDPYAKMAIPDYNGITLETFI